VIVSAEGTHNPDIIPTIFYVDVPYRDVVDLDATLELVANDRAGNESAPSVAGVALAQRRRAGPTRDASRVEPR